jgi:hypothetical protein
MTNAKTGSSCVAKPGLELPVLLPPPPKCWDYYRLVAACWPGKRLFKNLHVKGGRERNCNYNFSKVNKCSREREVRELSGGSLSKDE